MSSNRKSSAFETISLLGGIFAGAMIVLLIFVIVVVIFRRRRSRESQPRRLDGKGKSPYPDWVEVAEGNCSSGMAMLNDSQDSDSSPSKIARKFQNFKTAVGKFGTR